MTTAEALESADFLKRCIGRRYWFASGVGPISPVLAVAVQGRGGRGGSIDWAAYIAGLGTYTPEDDNAAAAVYYGGAKLDEATARAMFPGIAEDYRP